MKRINGMIYPTKKKTKYGKCTCTKCGKDLTPRTAYYYVDACNCAITDNAPPFCYKCYVEEHGRR